MAMSQEHKDALARGRKEARAINAYLESLAPRRRGRPITTASISKRLETLNAQIRREKNALRRVEMTQKRMDLETQLAQMKAAADRSGLEKGFIANAAAYSERKGISYGAWREAGVPAAVLGKAGIKR